MFLEWHGVSREAAQEFCERFEAQGLRLNEVVFGRVPARAPVGAEPASVLPKSGLWPEVHSFLKARAGKCLLPVWAESVAQAAKGQK